MAFPTVARGCRVLGDGRMLMPMRARIGIRRETKWEWERRAPLTPNDVRDLIQNHHLEVVVQPSRRRIFSDEEYRRVGALVQEDLSEVPVIFGIKEIQPQYLEPHKTYVIFSHTFKGQRQNLPMLRRLVELRDTLIDYEKITDERATGSSSSAGLRGSQG